MLKRSFTLTLAVLLLNLFFVAPVDAGSSLTKEEKRLAKFKQQIAKAGIGPQARVGIRLRDKTEVIGFVSAAGDDYLVITDAKTAAVTNLKYAQIQRIKLMSTVGSTMSSRTTPAGIFKKVIIGVGLVLTAVAIGCVVSKRCVE